jgi:hypothetical protein
MSALTSGLRLGRRELAFGLVVAAFLMISTMVPAAAHAAGCTGDTWTNTAGGKWSTGTNWSKKAPPTSEEEACITEKGTYTVELQASETKVKGITVGASSGTQTLAIDTTCAFNSVVTTTGGLSIGAHGAVSLSNAETCGNSVTVKGPITNAGELSSEVGIGGHRTLEGNLTNTGTVAINTTTEYDGKAAALSNQGTINIATGQQLQVSNEGTVTNGSGGSIAATGTGALLMKSGTSFTEGAGTTSGTLPVIVDDAALTYNAGGGESTIAARGEGSTLSGSSSAKQSLIDESTCGEHAKLTAASGFSNGGAITLTNAETCGNNATLVASGGSTITNTGTITTEPAIGGHRTLEGNLTNKGTIAINANTEYAGTSPVLINEGAIDVAENITLTVADKGSLTNGTGGSISAATGGDVFLNSSGTTFSEGAGTTGGASARPVILDDAALHYTGSGASSITQYGEGGTLEGNISGGQSLNLESTCGEHNRTTAANGFSNAGTITLTNLDITGNECTNNARLTVSSGTLTNTGTIASEQALGGTRTIEGNLTNQGTLAINRNTEYGGTGPVLTNEGAIDVAENVTLTVANKGSLTNGSGGKISAASGGDVFLNSTKTTFTEGAGTIGGASAKPVILDDAALHYTGSGAGLITQHGEGSTLEGNISSGQALTLESTCGEHERTIAGSSLSNAGTITLTNGETCPNNARLTVSSGTLTNTGTITTEPGVGGRRTIEGNLTNKGTLQLNKSTEYEAGVLKNDGTISIANGVVLSAPNNDTIENEGGTIAATGNGALSQRTGKFVQGAGKETGTLPVILDDQVLDYVGTGTGTIALRGSSTLGGTPGKKGLINKGQTLSLQTSCTENASVTAPGFLNSGTIVLTSGESCGNSVGLKLGTETLQNKGTIDVETPHGGNREIEGTLENEKVVSFVPTASNAATLEVDGRFTETSKGQIKTQIFTASAYGAINVTGTPGTATIAGKLAVKQEKGYVAKSGETFTIVKGSSLTGTFSKVSGTKVKGKGGLELKPHYTSNAAQLIVES